MLGARRVGKSTLLNFLLSGQSENYKISKFNGDDPDDVSTLSGGGLDYLKSVVGEKSIVFIDEAQKLPNIGNITKLMVDHYGKTKQIILSGSSSINLLDQTTEPLTGRKYVLNLYPLSVEEILTFQDLIAVKKRLEQILLFGLYPEVYIESSFEEKKEILDELTSSYLYKDILELQNIKNPNVLRDLLKALALQVGSEVSYNELSSLLGIDKNTVLNYVDLLEKNFVVFRLGSYRTNKRREISHGKKIYFWDLGVRNDLINDFRDLSLRTDVGALWENFCVAERIKYQKCHKIRVNNYFWRTYDGAEIDWVEEYPDRLDGYEFKYNSYKKVRVSKTWQSKGNTNFKIVNPENFLNSGLFVL